MRRAHVIEIFCDNGTNYIGAEREFFKNETFQNRMKNHFVNQNTKFNFISPRSPHLGELWKRAVKKVKHHIRRVVGDVCLT